MKKNVSTFQVHEKALAAVVTALYSKNISARARRAGSRSMTLSICSTRKEHAAEALIESGYGDVTFNS